mgnify:FL=1
MLFLFFPQNITSTTWGITPAPTPDAVAITPSFVFDSFVLTVSSVSGTLSINADAAVSPLAVVPETVSDVWTVS